MRKESVVDGHSNASVPILSLVVGTIGRVAALEVLLRSLSEQSNPNFEVILIDQSKTAEGIEGLVTRFSERFSLIHIVDSGIGLSRARNIGIGTARGRIVGFPDDDCWYSDSVVNSVIDFFEHNQDSAVLMGMYTEPGLRNPTFPIRPCNVSFRNVVGRVSSVGMFVSRDLVGPEILRFDESIGAGTEMPIGEEVDLAFRIVRSGLKVFYDPSLVVYHSIDRQKSQSRKMYMSNRESFWYVIGKNYFPVYSEYKIAKSIFRGIVGSVPYGFRACTKSMWTGYKRGKRSRS